MLSARRSIAFLLGIVMLAAALVFWLTRPARERVQPPSGDNTLESNRGHKAKWAEVEKRIAQIPVGMKRSQVELLFPQQDGGIQVPSVSRYYEDPEVMIEVPFDQTGGAFNENNRVTGQPKMYRSFAHAD